MLQLTVPKELISYLASETKVDDDIPMLDLNEEPTAPGRRAARCRTVMMKRHKKWEPNLSSLSDQPNRLT